MSDFFKKIIDCMSDNTISLDYEFWHYVFIAFLYSIMIFMLSLFIQRIRKRNVLSLIYDGYTFIFWILGSVFVWILLDTTHIIKRSNITVLVVCFVWDVIFHKMFSKSNDVGKDIGNDNIEEGI